MVTIARRDAPAETLEGIFVAGAAGETRGALLAPAGGALLAPPHPLYGGSLESPLLTELAFACTRRGLASLRFNWRGVGASAGEPSGDSADADADYFAALEQLAESVAGPLVAGGYSFGSAVAVRVARTAARVDRLLLVAPPPGLIAPGAILATGIRALVLVGEYDAIAPARELAAAFERAPQIELHVIPHADHFFMEGLAEVGRLASAWLERS